MYNLAKLEQTKKNIKVESSLFIHDNKLFESHKITDTKENEVKLFEINELEKIEEIKKGVL